RESIAIGGGEVVVTAIERAPAEHSPRSFREREESLDFILGNAPLTFYTTDRNGVLTMSAGKALSRLGLKTGELVGKSVIDLYGALPVRLADGSAISVAEVNRRVVAGEVVSGRSGLSVVVRGHWLYTF